MGLFDTHAALILLQCFSAFGIFLLRQFFLGIPKELSEAATIDGCGHFRILWQIILPLSKSAVSALVIFSFIKVWNDYMAPLIYLQTPSKRTVQLGLSLFRSQYSMELSLIHIFKLAVAVRHLAVTRQVTIDPHKKAGVHAVKVQVAFCLPLGPGKLPLIHAAGIFPGHIGRIVGEGVCLLYTSRCV